MPTDSEGGPAQPDDGSSGQAERAKRKSAPSCHDAARGPRPGVLHAGGALTPRLSRARQVTLCASESQAPARYPWAVRVADRDRAGRESRAAILSALED